MGRILKAVLVVGFFLLPLLYKTSPLLFHLDTHIPINDGEPLLVTWILAWGFHALTTRPFEIFDANILYPVRDALAFSEHMLGVFPVFAPPYALTGNPIFAHNVTLLASFVLSGVAMFLLVRHHTGSVGAALVSGYLYAFSPIRFNRIDHLHMLNQYWLPVALLFLDRFFLEKRRRDLVGFLLCYWLQGLSSVYLGWFATIAVILYVSHFITFVKWRIVRRPPLVLLGVGAILSALLFLSLHRPYFRVQQQWGVGPRLQEVIDQSADPASYVRPALVYGYGAGHPYAKLFPIDLRVLHVGEKTLFPGLVLPALILLGWLPASDPGRNSRSQQVRQAFRLIFIAAILLSFGPTLALPGTGIRLPMPYQFLFDWIPGFGGMKSAARFAHLALLAGSVLAAFGYLRLTRRGGRIGRAAAFLACCLLMHLDVPSPRPLPLARVPTGRDVPQVYRWLAREQPGPIAEIPGGLGWWGEYRYMYYSTYHWLPLMNGISGYLPWFYRSSWKMIETLPSPAAVHYLRRIGVKAVILHSEKLSPDASRSWQALNPEEVGLRERARFDADIVYEIRWGPDPSAAKE